MIYTHVDVSIYHTVHTFHRDVKSKLSYLTLSAVCIHWILFWCFLLTNISQTYIFPRHSNDLHQLSALWRCRYLVFSSTLPHRKKALPVFCKESSISKHDLHCHLKDRKYIMKLQFKHTVVYYSYHSSRHSFTLAFY